MQVIYRAADGKEFTDQGECAAYEELNKERWSKQARDRKASEDFRFMVLCAAKGNMSMYHLLSDRSA